jgi:hypothetical protein
MLSFQGAHYVSGDSLRERFGSGIYVVLCSKYANEGFYDMGTWLEANLFNKLMKKG